MGIRLHMFQQGQKFDNGEYFVVASTEWFAFSMQ